MIGCFFRFRGNSVDGSEIHDVGFACAKDETELFWAIDEFGDPYEVMVKEPVSGFSVSVSYELDDLELGIGVSESLRGIDSWVKPVVTDDCELILPWINRE